MAKNVTRKYAVKIKGSSASEIIHAAFWSVDAVTLQGRPEAAGFVVFKAVDHQSVFGVRSDSVEYIREVVDRPVVDMDWDELRIASVALSNEGARGGKAKTKDQAEYHEKAAALAQKFIAADRNVTIAPRDPIADIINQVQGGWISIDEARDRLKELPWGEPEDGEHSPW